MAHHTQLTALRRRIGPVTGPRKAALDAFDTDDVLYLEDAAFLDGLAFAFGLDERRPALHERWHDRFGGLFLGPTAWDDVDRRLVRLLGEPKVFLGALHGHFCESGEAHYPALERELAALGLPEASWLEAALEELPAFAKGRVTSFGRRLLREPTSTLWRWLEHDPWSLAQLLRAARPAELDAPRLARALAARAPLVGTAVELLLPVDPDGAVALARQARDAVPRFRAVLALGGHPAARPLAEQLRDDLRSGKVRDGSLVDDTRCEAVSEALTRLLGESRRVAARGRAPKVTAPKTPLKLEPYRVEQRAAKAVRAIAAHLAASGVKARQVRRIEVVRGEEELELAVARCQLSSGEHVLVGLRHEYDGPGVEALERRWRLAPESLLSFNDSRKLPAAALELAWARAIERDLAKALGKAAFALPARAEAWLSSPSGRRITAADREQAVAFAEAQLPPALAAEVLTLCFGRRARGAR